MSRAITIGALSARTGCNVETIRYYERIGLIGPPPRSQGGYRLYGAEETRRLAFVRRARALGFTLEDVRALLRLADDRRDACGEVRDLAAKHLDDVRARIADLEAMARALEETIAGCGSDARGACPLIESLSAAPG